MQGSTTGTLSSGTSGSLRTSLILLHETNRRRIRLCHFCTFIDIVTETAIVPLEHCPLDSHCQQSTRILCTRCCPWILDGVSFIISISGAKILISYILLDTSFYHCLQSVKSRSCCLLMNVQVVQFHSNTVFNFSDSRIRTLYNPSKISSGGIFVFDNKISSHFESNA